MESSERRERLVDLKPDWRDYILQIHSYRISKTGNGHEEVLIEGLKIKLILLLLMTRRYLMTH